MEAALETIPDGVYSDRLIQEVSRNGDRGTYPVQTTVRKKGKELIWDNVGTHDQVGAINVGFAAWRGAILGAINVLMLPGQMGCIGGAARLCTFDPEPGKITSPDWGAAVSPAGVYATETAISLCNALVSKMMLASSDETLRANAVTPDGAQWPCHFVAGENQRGDYYVGGMGDNMLGGGGATAWRDGEFANGHFWIPEGRGPNVEAYEADWPILYLFRREHADSGGAGRSRAGNGGEIAYVPHKGESFLGLATNEGIPKTPGLFGGNPGSIMVTRVIQGSDLRAKFAAGEMPQDLDELGGTELQIGGKPDGFPVGDDDVLYWNWLAPGGYGDPLTRDPDEVIADLRSGAISPHEAGEVYCVRLDARGQGARPRGDGETARAQAARTAARLRGGARRDRARGRGRGRGGDDRRRLRDRPRPGRLPLPPLRHRPGGARRQPEAGDGEPRAADHTRSTRATRKCRSSSTTRSSSASTAAPAAGCDWRPRRAIRVRPRSTSCGSTERCRSRIRPSRAGCLSRAPSRRCAISPSAVSSTRRSRNGPTRRRSSSPPTTTSASRRAGPTPSWASGRDGSARR